MLAFAGGGLALPASGSRRVFAFRKNTVRANCIEESIMPKIDKAAVDLFQEKAKPVSIQMVTVKDLDEAMRYAVDVCEKKEPFKPMLPLPDDAARRKTLAAPGLEDKEYAALSAVGKEKGFEMIRAGLRSHLAGIDVAFTVAELGIAETATSVMQCASEDLRLSTMICEVHVLALAKSKILKTSYDAEAFLHKAMAKGPNYTSFISGPSRTADIERVLTLGVHGPLELHIAFMEE
jgi:L-lactate dehydrogenase complex protein LldG